MKYSVIEPLCWKGINVDLQNAFLTINEDVSHVIEKVLKDEFIQDVSSITSLITDAKIRLERGLGFCIIKGLGKIDYNLDDYAKIALFISKYIGDTVPQNKKGEHVVLVQDNGLTTQNPDHRGHKTNDELGFHNDRCDIIMLLCQHQAMQGGESTLVSAKYIHDLIAKLNPEYIKCLYEPFPNHRRGEQREGQATWCMMPIFAQVDDKFVCRFVKRFITDSKYLLDCPPLNDYQINAMEFMDKMLNDSNNYLTFKLQPGEMLLINNHTLLHGRSHYEDSGSFKRTLIRVWLSHKESRKLPDSFKDLYHNIEPGSIRGGI